MIDLSSETLLTFAQASKALPGRPHIATLHRFRQRGIRGIHLETVLVGGRRFTSREALQRFVERTTAAAAGERLPVKTARQRQRSRAEAERRLDRARV